MAVLADDGISGADEYGRLWASDGKPLVRVAGLSDFTLRDHRCRAVCTELTPRWLQPATAAALRAGAATTVAASAASSEHHATMLGDSAAGEIFHPLATGQTHIRVELADGSEITAVGGEHLFVWLCDDGGAYHLVNLGPAYRMMVPEGNKPLDLLSFPALKRIGCTTVLSADDDGSYVQDAPARFPLKWTGQLWTMTCEVSRGTATAAPAITPETVRRRWSPRSLGAAPATERRTVPRESITPVELVDEFDGTHKASDDEKCVAGDGVELSSHNDIGEATEEAQWGADTGITVDNSVVVPREMPRDQADTGSGRRLGRAIEASGSGALRTRGRRRLAGREAQRTKWPRPNTAS